jgi:hypothetical protein
MPDSYGSGAVLGPEAEAHLGADADPMSLRVADEPARRD